MPIRPAALAFAMLTFAAMSVAQAANDSATAPDPKAAARTAELLHDTASPVLGNPQGDVTIAEFFDYQCPFTKRAEPRLEAFLAKDKGARLIVKDFPILTPESRIAAKAALASVKQGKHDAFHRAMLAHQGPVTEADIFTIAAAVGLDVDQLKRDMNDPAIADHIISDFNLARGLKVTTTPGFVVGGQVLTQPSAEINFDEIAAAERAAAKK